MVLQRQAGADYRYRVKQMTLRDRLINESLLRKDGCRVWLGSRDKRGYGMLQLGPDWVAASRAMWMAFRGPIPKGLCVLHKCDNPPCISLEHLFLGTQLDNIDDMHKKKRHAYGRKVPQAKLNDSVVRWIRWLHASGLMQRRSGTQKWLTSFLGVGRESIRRATRGRSWKHVQ